MSEENKDESVKEEVVATPAAEEKPAAEEAPGAEEKPATEEAPAAEA